MNRKLKFFMISFFSALVLGLLLLSYISSLSGWEVLGFIIILPVILAIALLIFISISVKKAAKGERLKLSLITTAGFVLAIVLIITALSLYSTYSDYKFDQDHEEARAMIDIAIKDNDIDKCYGVSFVSYGVAGCRLWVAYENQNYSICEGLPEGYEGSTTSSKACWLMALVKTKDKSYCDNFEKQEDKGDCLEVYSRFSNQTFIDYYNPEDPKFRSDCSYGRASTPARCDYEYSFYVSYPDLYTRGY